MYDRKSDVGLLSENKDSWECYDDNEGNENGNNKDMNEVEKFLERMFGKDWVSVGEGREMKEESGFGGIEELVNCGKSVESSVDKLSREKSCVREEVSNVNGEVGNVKEMGEVGKKEIGCVGENGVGRYKKVMGEKGDESMVRMLNGESRGMVSLMCVSKD